MTTFASALEAASAKAAREEASVKSAAEALRPAISDKLRRCYQEYRVSSDIFSFLITTDDPVRRGCPPRELNLANVTGEHARSNGKMRLVVCLSTKI